MKKEVFIITAVLLMVGAGCSLGTGSDRSTAVTSNTRLEVDAPGTSDSPPKTDESGTYTNTQFGFSISQPDGWEMKEGFFGSVVALFSPLSSETDDFSENVNVVVGDLEGLDVSLSEYTDLNIEQLEGAIESFTLSNKKQMKIGNMDAMETSYSGNMQGEQLSWSQWYLINDSKAYVITYTGKGADYDASLGQAKEIVQTFRIN